MVRLLEVRGNTLDVMGVDVLDGTPLLDIKPYVPEFDVHPGERIGWFAGNVTQTGQTRADDRFSADPKITSMPRAGASTDAGACGAQ